MDMKLFNEITGEDAKSIKDYVLQCRKEGHRHMSQHDFMIRCKEWAWKNRYMLRTSYRDMYDGDVFIEVIRLTDEEERRKHNTDVMGVIMTNLGAAEEYKGIFRACKDIKKRLQTTQTTP